MRRHRPEPPQEVTIPYARPKKPLRPARSVPWPLQSLLALLGGLILFVFLIVTVIFSYRIYYSGRVYPGVYVAGADLGGLRPSLADEALASQVPYTQEGLVGIRYGERTWILHPEELGLTMSRSESVQTAYDWGRRGSLLTQLGEQFQAWHGGVNLAPIYVLDERMAQQVLERIAAEIDKPMVEAALSVRGKEITIQAAQEGRQVDVPATLAELQTQLKSLRSGFVTLAVNEQKPAVLDVSAEAEIARKMLSAPLVLSLPQAGKDDPVTRLDLENKLIVQRVAAPPGESGGDRYAVSVNPNALHPTLQQIAQQTARSPQDARYHFNEETRELEVIQPAVVGRSLVIEKSIQTIQDELRAGNHAVTLVYDQTNPRLTDEASAREMGINEVVSSYTSYFYGSDGARIQNIQTAAARFDGVLVAPGEVFSAASVLGNVDLDSGYAEAWIIFGDRTIKGVGGGVCQVSTTLFRTAFFGGYAIEERYPHAYRVSYYEYTAGARIDEDLAGLDATVYVPVVDFKFRNDSASWILMTTKVDAPGRSLTWKFYSTPDGRTVDWQTSGLQNVVDPPPARYTENLDLSAGDIKQVDWAVAGADVHVTRTVTKDGQVLSQDDVRSHYMPWADAYEYGYGAVLPDEAGQGEETGQ